jgi:hypothetical protein
MATSSVVDGVLDGEACAVKDSFADLDLAAAGYSILFDASWVHRRPQAVDVAARPPWSVARTEPELAAWAAAAGVPGSIGPQLLDVPGVRFLFVADGGEIVAGAALNTTDDVVGVSNVFAAGVPEGEVWAGLTALLDERFPARNQVGYEREPHLEAAQRSGFAVLGPLRVWHRPGSG